ncbi:MAG: auxin-responsive protein, partial [Planctomycetaceae bacterium]|nr:auxin-responsive protein [Planctomycetaceae bacterium]
MGRTELVAEPLRILYRLRAFVGAIPRASVRRQARKFLRATRDCRTSQRAVLDELLALNAGSRFSREHRLDEVQTVAHFRKHLPVADYEGFRPYIERLKQGDFGALLGANQRLLMFSLSSGTTSESKFIPITARFLKDYRAGWQSWGIHVLDDHP